ncbi:MAG TPA: GatB/YqeY domain-containing protein [Dissulfurispiraceae bacterium]|nr:GatB/YqeY domain-containing protein [Dissulfurispiraceae bacterium]
MPILETIDNDLRQAMKARDALRTSVIRMMKASLKNREIEKGSTLSDEDVLSVLSSLSKQRRESIEQFRNAGRADLAAKEEEEFALIQTYLPRQLSPDELDVLIVAAIRESGASGPGDLGRVMQVLMPKIKGLADGKIVNQKVRDLLNPQQ